MRFVVAPVAITAFITSVPAIRHFESAAMLFVSHCLTVILPIFTYFAHFYFFIVYLIAIVLRGRDYRISRDFKISSILSAKVIRM